MNKELSYLHLMSKIPQVMEARIGIDNALEWASLDLNKYILHFMLVLIPVHFRQLLILWNVWENVGLSWPFTVLPASIVVLHTQLHCWWQSLHGWLTLVCLRQESQPRSEARLVAWFVHWLGGTGFRIQVGLALSSSCHLILVCVNNDLYGSLHINSRLHARLNNQISHPIPSSVVLVDYWMQLSFVTSLHCFAFLQTKNENEGRRPGCVWESSECFLMLSSMLLFVTTGSSLPTRSTRVNRLCYLPWIMGRRWLHWAGGGAGYTQLRAV